VACPEFTLTRAFSARARARFSWRFSLISRSTISVRLVTSASPLSLGRRPRFGAGRSEAPWVLRGRPARRRGAADAISVAAVVVISSVVMTPLLARSDSFIRTPSGIKYGSTPPQYGLSMAASTYTLNCETHWRARSAPNELPYATLDARTQTSRTSISASWTTGQAAQFVEGADSETP